MLSPLRPGSEDEIRGLQADQGDVEIRHAGGGDMDEVRAIGRDDAGHDRFPVSDWVSDPVYGIRSGASVTRGTARFRTA